MLDAPGGTVDCRRRHRCRPEGLARAATVRTLRRSGWCRFAAGFIDRGTAVVEELVGALRGADGTTPRHAEALADFDVTESPVATPVCWRSLVCRHIHSPDSLARIASGVKDGWLVVL